MGYHYLYGPEIASDGAHPERDNYEQVLLLQRLKHAFRRINSDIPVDAQNEVFKEIKRITKYIAMKIILAFNKNETSDEIAMRLDFSQTKNDYMAIPCDN